MDWGSWVAFLGASVLLTLIPGPDILFVITQSMAGSRKDGSAVALGLCTGLLAHISAAALGVSAVVYRSEIAFQTVKMLGAAYLFYLAWQSWVSSSKKQITETEDGGPRGSGDRRLSFGRLYRRGILMNVLNPKVSLFFVAFLPQFVVPDGGPIPVQMIVLGGSFLLQALVIFHVVAFAAGRLGRQWIRGAAAHRRTARIQAVIYALLGAQMLFFLLRNW
jgi:threonine/homoserine/homoserine lactone efflux protein